MTMSEAAVIRRRTDVAKLRELQARIPRFLEILGVSSDPPRSIRLRIRIPTARNNAYPREKQEINDVEITLPESYPQQPGPYVTFTTPIFNPNIYPSGKWCSGEWKIMEYLDLFVMRLMKVIAFDPTIVNPRSPANGEAAQWFVQTRNRHPDLFPTIPLDGLITNIEKPKIVWRTIK